MQSSLEESKKKSGCYRDDRLIWPSGTDSASLKFTKTEIALENSKENAAHLPERTQVHRVQHIDKSRERVRFFIRFFLPLLGKMAEES